MSEDSRVTELLIDWDEARARGENISIDELCRDCPELADEVAERIEALRAMQSALDTATDGTDTDLGDPVDFQLPGFECLGILGRGGMGVVYKARQASLQRTVAVKMIRSAGLAENALARFRTEAEAVARLQHPNIVHIHEVGEHDGQPFFVLEYVDGGNLSAKLTSQTLPAAEAARLTETLARAVHSAHESGVVHRDIKPSNVLLTAAGTPKLTDFGLAKRLDGDSDLTRTGDVMGTPSYMAPEQARGNTDQVTAATDIYALGATLYEMIAGRPPFVGATPLETLQQIVSQEVLPPSRVQPGIPRDLETVCLKCLEKPPERRYASAADFAEDLQRFLAGQTVRARPVGRAARAGRWIKRHPARAGLITMAAIAVAAFIGLGVGAAYQDRLETVNHDLSDSLNREQRLTQQLQSTLKREKAVAEKLDRALDFRRVALAHSHWKNNQLALARNVLAQVPVKRRHFEWHYIDRMCRADVLTLQAHRGEIIGVTFSRDGQRIATAARDQFARVWDVKTGRQLLQFPIPRWQASTIGRPCGIAFSPDGSRLATGVDNAVEIWNVKTGKRIRRLQLPTKSLVRRIAFNADGSQITAGNAAAVFVWNATSGQPVLRHQIPKKSPRGFLAGPHFHPDGQTVVASTANVLDRKNHAVAYFDLKAGIETKNLPIPYADGRVAFSRDGKHIACIDENPGTIRIVDGQSGRELLTVAGHDGGTYCASFSPDGKTLTSGGSDFLARSWNAATGAAAITHRGHTSHITNLTYNFDGTMIAAGGFDGRLIVWKALEPPERRHIERLSNYFYSAFASFARDGKTLYCGGFYEGAFVSVRETTKREKIHHWKQRGATVYDFCHRTDGVTIAAMSNGGKLQICDAKTGKLIRNLEGNAKDIGSAFPRFDSTGKLIASPTGDNTIRIWETATGRIVRTLKNVTVRGPAEQDGIARVAFSPDGKLIAAGDSQTVRIWETDTGRELHRLKGHQRRVTGVAFGPDGNSIASAGADGIARIWDVKSGGELSTLKGHTARVNCVAFSPDGKRVVTAGRDGTVRLWEPETGLETLTLKSGGWDSASVAFSPDGKRIVAADMYGFKLWDARSGNW